MNDKVLPVVDDAGVPLTVPPLRRVDVHVFRAPIDEPVRTSFGVMLDRPAVVVRVEDGDGAVGWGESWCNFPNCGAEHRARLSATVLAPRLLGRGFDSPVHAFDTLDGETRILALQTREFGPLAQAIAGVDVALWDLVARRAGLPLYRLLGGPRAAASVPTYASGINPASAIETIARARESGYDRFKIKIGFDPAADERVVADVAGFLTQDEEFMVDANQGWTIAQALQRLPMLSRARVAWLEEPLPVDAAPADWHRLAQASDVTLAGGENLASIRDFTDAIEAGDLGVLQPDICKWGGISRNLPIVRHALRVGRRFCPHYLGGGIGLMASAHVLAAAGGDGLLEVDVNPNALRDALAAGSALVHGHTLTLPDAPGLGMQPSLDALRGWQTLHLSETC